MSKSTTSHFMATFQTRAMALSEVAKTSGEQEVAIATSWSGMFELHAQNNAQLKGVS